MSEINEIVMDKTDLDELIQEVEEETQANPTYDNHCRSFLLNLKRSWRRVPPQDVMRRRFQKLAGIINNKTLAALTLPSGQRITFDELPHWWGVVRYKVCGFKYETYE